MVRCIWLAGWACGIAAVVTAQPPGDPPNKPGKDKEPSALERLRLPADAVIVIMDDVRKAISEMKPGSVLLSAERYQALMEKLGQLERATATARAESLLSGCRISGTIKPTDAAERENLELRLDLELRTEAPITLVPIPLRGFRLVRATLDGEPPIWGPDPDNLSVLMKEANKTSVLTLIGQVPLAKVGPERRVRLDRFPPAAITTMDLEIHEAVAAATVRNGGPVRIEALTPERSRLAAGALGVLSSFELTWRSAAAADRQMAPVFSAWTQQRINVDEGLAETEAVQRLEVVQGEVALLRVRLADEVTDARVERVNRDPPQPLEATKTIAGWLVRLPESLTANEGPIMLRWRWTQRVPPAGTALGLGFFDLVEPRPDSQSGTVAVTLPPEARARWTTYQLTKAEPRDLAPGEARGSALLFRYRMQPARLDLIFDPAGETMPTVEALWQHTVRVLPEQLQLASDLEIIKPARANLTEVDLRWPVGWSLSGRLLLTPGVEGMSHDPRRGTVRLKLNARAVGTLKLRLEGTAPVKAIDRGDVTLPVLVTAQGEVGGRAAVLAVTRRDVPVRLEMDQVEVQIEEGAAPVFLAEPAAMGGSGTLRSWTWTLPAPPTDAGGEAAVRLVFAKRPLRPRVAVAAKAYLLPSDWVIRQSVELVAPGTNPRELTVQLPVSWRDGAQAFWQEPAKSPADRQGTRPLQITGVSSRVAAGTAAAYRVAWPTEATAGARLWLEYRIPRGRGDTTLEVPLAQLLADEVVEETPRRVRLWSLAPEILEPATGAGGWRPLPRTADGDSTPPEWYLEATPNHPTLAVTAAKPTVAMPDWLAARVWHDARCLPDGTVAVMSRWYIQRLRRPVIALRLPSTVGTPTVDQAAIQGERLRDSQLELVRDRTGRTVLQVQLDPAWYDRSFSLEIAYRVQGTSTIPFLVSPPPLVADGLAVVDQSRWRVEPAFAGLPLVLRGSARLDQTWSWSWGLHPPMPGKWARPLMAWFQGAGDPGPDEDDVAAFSLTQAAGPAGLTLLVLPRLPTIVLASTVIVALGWGWRLLPARWRRSGLAWFLLLPLMASAWPELASLLLYTTAPGWVVLLVVLALTSRRAWWSARRDTPIPTFVRQSTPAPPMTPRGRRESSVSGHAPATVPTGEGPNR